MRQRTLSACSLPADEPCPFGPHGIFGSLALIGGKIVEDDDIAFGQGWSELGLDPDLEDAPVHGLIDDEGRGQATLAQTCDEGLDLPMSEWCFAM
jgi:hypothetical protein